MGIEPVLLDWTQFTTDYAGAELAMRPYVNTLQVDQAAQFEAITIERAIPLSERQYNSLKAPEEEENDDPSVYVVRAYIVDPPINPQSAGGMPNPFDEDTVASDETVNRTVRAMCTKFVSAYVSNSDLQGLKKGDTIKVFLFGNKEGSYDLKYGYLDSLIKTGPRTASPTSSTTATTTSTGTGLMHPNAIAAFAAAAGVPSTPGRQSAAATIEAVSSPEEAAELAEATLANFEAELEGNFSDDELRYYKAWAKARANAFLENYKPSDWVAAGKPTDAYYEDNSIGALNQRALDQGGGITGAATSLTSQYVTSSW